MTNLIASPITMTKSKTNKITLTISTTRSIIVKNLIENRIIVKVKSMCGNNDKVNSKQNNSD